MRGGMMMKIAVVSDDGVYISQHFGCAMLYVVSTVENGKVVKKEQRPKVGHHHVLSFEPEKKHQGKHGYDDESKYDHELMAKPITDCQVLITGGMGWGAYDSMKSFNMEPIITEVVSIQEAVKLYIDGKLVNRTERLH
jgi:predicted Fe-Mo cluster-binding NifX family protein